MALLRKCLNELRTRRLPPDACAFALASAPDTVVPPDDGDELGRLRAASAALRPSGARPLAARAAGAPPA
jgi:hypothetical protein